MLPPRSDSATPKENDEDGEEDDEDVTMSDSGSNGTSAPLVHIANQAYAYTSPQSITASPAIEAQANHHYSSYASSGSTLPSPACGPQQGHGGSQSSLSASLSPTLMPSREQDQEATAALLMLNKDRRNPKGGRAMSVRDLLSH